ncbi:hypothetical protein M0P65_07690 [Candidatus Gracilibacteria bacterium]|nr:hypothetical protein [Candidatus Gracilibacteria bacterium]
MIILLTRKPKESLFDLKFYSSEFLTFLKKITKKQRGPEAVIASAIRGFEELHVVYKINPKLKEINNSTVWVIKDYRTLKLAIELKKMGVIKKLLAGPIISVLPEDHNSILLNKNIDKIIFPSQWPKDFFVYKYPFLKNKIETCPAGVDSNIYKPQEKEFDFLIYNKNKEEISEKIIEILEKKNLTYKKIEYGKFKPGKYYNLLNKTKFLIYLSNSESQGIALNEAWAANVPTFVLKNTKWQYQGNTWQDDKISAPYLTEETGGFFEVENMENDLNTFLNKEKTFKPREYSLNHFSDKIVTQKIIDIITAINN